MNYGELWWIMMNPYESIWIHMNPYFQHHFIRDVSHVPNQYMKNHPKRSLPLRSMGMMCDHIWRATKITTVVTSVSATHASCLVGTCSSPSTQPSCQTLSEALRWPGGIRQMCLDGKCPKNGGFLAGKICVSLYMVIYIYKFNYIWYHSDCLWYFNIFWSLYIIHDTFYCQNFAKTSSLHSSRQAQQLHPPHVGGPRGAVSEIEKGGVSIPMTDPWCCYIW